MRYYKDMERWRVAVLLAVVFAVMYGLNVTTPPTLSDDVLYKCVWTPEEWMPRRPVTTPADVVESQMVHYRVVNGRIVVHTVAQLFIGIVGKDVFNVFNAALFCLLVWLCAVFAAGGCGRNRGMTEGVRVCGGNGLFVPVLLSVFLFFVFVPGFQDAFLWFVGSFNYLWTAVGVLSFLIYYYREKDAHVGWRSMAVCPLALLAGWTHEGLTLPLSLGFGLWVVVERRRVAGSAVLPAVLCFVAGTALSAFSPGTLGRAGATETPLLGRLLFGCYNMVAFVRVFWLLAVAVAVAWWRRREVMVEEFRHRYVLYFALLMSMGIVVVCGQTEARVCFHADFIALLLLVSLLVRCGVADRLGRVKAVAVGMCGVMAAIALPVLSMAAVNKSCYDSQLAQQRAAGVNIVRVRHLPESGSAVFDNMIKRYVKPSVEFGIFSCYQGFDTDDVNLRSAAAVYGKPWLMYLPEDVAARLCDGEAPETAFTDRYGEIGVMPVADGKRVTAMRFVLRGSRMAEMPLYRRLFAYKGDVYELPAIKFKTVKINGRSYLFFARPVKSITEFTEEVQIDSADEK